jgi:hypothetical protein
MMYNCGMDFNDDLPARFRRRIARYDRRIERLQALNSRFSWYRLAAFLAGGVTVWLAAARLGNAWGWRAFAAALAVFSLVVFLHRRLDRALERARTWRSLQTAHLARLELDWEALHRHTFAPAEASGGREPPPRSPLDIDLDLTGERSLHRLLDCAASLQGSRLLTKWLTLGHAEPQAIAERQSLVRELKPMQQFRDRLALVYRLAARERLDGDKLLGWLEEDIPTGRLRWALPVAGLWGAANLALFLLSLLNDFPAYWIISASFYLAFYYYNIRIFQQAFETIVELEGELVKFRPALRLLERRPIGENPHLAALLAPIRAGGQQPSRQLRRIALVTAGVGLRMNPILGLALNLFLPWDYLFAWLAAGARRRLRRVLPVWFQAFYTLEAAGSLANFAGLNPDYAFPRISDAAEPVFAAAGLGHPLIARGHQVRNDFHVDDLGDIAIITGSNMAGKSTFIKAVGVNLCLAYAGGPVDAFELRARPFRLYTVIRISDSISDGYSYFYAEVRRLKGLLELLDQDGPPVLYLVDEIFRGTNNRERLIGSRSTLRALLTKNGVGLLATHDLELATLEQESPKVRNYHFRDQVQDGRLAFDYRIHPGPSPTTNALRIMAMEGLPVEADQYPVEPKTTRLQ